MSHSDMLPPNIWNMYSRVCRSNKQAPERTVAYGMKVNCCVQFAVSRAVPQGRSLRAVVQGHKLASELHHLEQVSEARGETATGVMTRSPFAHTLPSRTGAWPHLAARLPAHPSKYSPNPTLQPHGLQLPARIQTHAQCEIGKLPAHPVMLLPPAATPRPSAPHRLGPKVPGGGPCVHQFGWFKEAERYCLVVLEDRRLEAGLLEGTCSLSSPPVLAHGGHASACGLHTSFSASIITGLSSLCVSVSSPGLLSVCVRLPVSGSLLILIKTPAILDLGPTLLQEDLSPKLRYNCNDPVSREGQIHSYQDQGFAFLEDTVQLT